MASIELYINKQLCDIDNPNNFSVYLKRQLINPAELSTKDAQRSYDITLPATPTNNSIFGHTNTEEVKAKFLEIYDAQLYVDGEKIFDGKFRMSEIAKDHYKGNLGIPAAKGIKDLFGEKKMNEIDGTWNIDFSGPESINKYNKEENPDCFFPLVMNNLLKKSKTSPLFGRYTNKDLLDRSVKLNMEDFPPSINCLKAIKKIFENSGFQISGSAFDDERLSKLYMSYRNPNDYEAPWITGMQPSVHIVGNWANVRGTDSNTIEDKYLQGNDIYKVNIFDSNNVSATTYLNNTDSSKMYEIKIPIEGLYKISLNATLCWRTWTPKGFPLNFRIGNIVPAYSMNDFNNSRLELKVVRTREGEPLDLKKMRFDNIFYKENIDQTPKSEIRHFPNKGYPNLIDPAVNENLLCGFSFGNKNPPTDFNPIAPPDEGRYHNTIVIKGGKSWKGGGFKESFSATNSRYSRYENGQVVNNEEHCIKLNNLPKPIKTEVDGYIGDGDVYQIVWLNKGDLISFVALSDSGKDMFGKPGWIAQEIFFNLAIKAFRHDIDWLKIDENGWGTDGMDWNDENNFEFRKMNLIKFLPSDVSISSWLDNFCKAFNLNIKQEKDGQFELNLKNRDYSNATVIDLDKKTDVNIDRANVPLNLPLSYNIGFKIDEKEHGYISSNDRGKDIIYTQSNNEKELKIETDFSYNWYKKLYLPTGAILPTPVITDNKVWEHGTEDYAEAQKEKYFDKAQRFWYKANDYDEDRTHQLPVQIKNRDVHVAETSNTLVGDKKMVLNYKDEPNSILNNYFVRYANADNCYTSIECFLSPEEYNNIDNSLAKFNGDLYYIADVDGYDPLCKKKAKLKLIRKQL